MVFPYTLSGMQMSIDISRDLIMGQPSTAIPYICAYIPPQSLYSVHRKSSISSVPPIVQVVPHLLFSI